jgi:hypothetical protein
MTSSPNTPNEFPPGGAVPPVGTASNDPFAAQTASAASSNKGHEVEDRVPGDESVDATEPKGPDAFAEALRRMGEAREYAGYLAAAQIDKFKLKLRRIAILAIAGIVAGILGLAILVSAAAILLQGVAGAIGELLGGRRWAGELITGGGILLLTALAAWLGLRMWQASAFKALQQRYARRKQKQRAQYGHSVDPLDDLPK